MNKAVLAEIITIGDELLIGQVIDTNSAWIAAGLNDIGIAVKQITSISDRQEHIVQTLEEAGKRADIIIITGGLGPTRDDVTRNSLCNFFQAKLIFDEKSFAIIESIFKSRGREVTDINRQQAFVPDNCTILHNNLGTAPGMLFEKEGKVYVALPGVPAEMKGLMSNTVFPLLKKRFSHLTIIHRTILTQGIAETFLADKIAVWEDNLPKNMKLAYLPSAGIVRLRISATGISELELKNEIFKEEEKLQSLVSEFIFGYEDDKLEALVGDLLRSKKKTLSTAESCTGGYIAHKITSIPGSSEYYLGSVIGYANEVKVHELGVDMNTLEKYGAVSEVVVQKMAQSALKKFGSDYAIACSGIAGPDGGSPEKPVGTVWIAIASHNRILTRKLQLGNHRHRVILETSNHALNTLRKLLLNEL